MVDIVIAKLPEDLAALFLPVQAVGKSNEHIRSPGTITYTAETAQRVWTEIGESVARAGVRKIVIVTTFGRPGYLAAAMTAGASGFLLKDAPAAELATAIRRVHAGERVVDPGLAAAALAEGASPLTAREAEVLAAARGHGSIADLAGRLHLSPGTVRNHLSAAIQKLGARNRAEAVQIAERKGWL